MALEQHLEKVFAQEAARVFQAALTAVDKLEGKVVISDPVNFSLEAKFPKTILGKTLGERTYLSCKVGAQEDGARVEVDAYPLDALERKLLFGARKGVTQTIVTWFSAHLENNLK